MVGRLAINGAGIAGLSALVALRRSGIPVTVYDRTPDPTPRGGAMCLFPNAIKALSGLGLGAALMEAGTPVTHFDFRSWRGESLGSLSFEPLIERYGGLPLLHIGRQDVVRILQAVAPTDALRYGTTCTGFVESADGVRPLFSGYGRLTQEPRNFAGLIGADGFHSVLRRQLLGVEKPSRELRQVAWSGLAETDARQWPYPAGRAVVMLGEGRLLFAGTLRPRPGDAGRVGVYWYATEPAAQAVAIGAGADLYRRFHPPAAGLIEHTAQPFSFKVRDRLPVRGFGRGCVTLIGDAAHPTTPDLSQGACQGIVGAVALARCLARAGDVASAFREYEREHFRRAAEASRFSRWMTIFTQLSTPGADALRNFAMRTWWPSVLLQKYERLHDEPSGAQQ